MSTYLECHFEASHNQLSNHFGSVFSFLSSFWLIADSTSLLTQVLILIIFSMGMVRPAALAVCEINSLVFVCASPIFDIHELPSLIYERCFLLSYCEAIRHIKPLLLKLSKNSHSILLLLQHLRVNETKLFTPMA